MLFSPIHYFLELEFYEKKLLSNNVITLITKTNIFVKLYLIFVRFERYKGRMRQIETF